MRTATGQLDRQAIEDHLTALHHCAAGTNGLLVLAAYGEDPVTGRALTPMIEHFAIGDVKDMTARAMTWAVLPHCNVYAPLAVMRADLPTGKKGEERDIVKVLGLVADFDDAHATKWATRSPIRPTAILETSPRRFQAFYLFDRPVDMESAKALARRLHAHTRCDFGTKDVSHVWRIGGTLNWPNKKKVEEGRSAEPFLVAEIPGGTQTAIDPAALDHSLPALNGAEVLHLVAPRSSRGAVLPRKTRLTPPDPIPDTLQDELDGRGKDPDRSTLFFKVVNELDRLGFHETAIVDMLKNNSHVTPERYSERMLTEVRACIQKGTEPAIEAVNRTFAEVVDRGQSVFVTEGVDSRTGMQETYVLSVPQLRDRLAAEPVPRCGKGKRLAENMAEFWRKHPHHRCYEGGFVLKPDQSAEVSEYNLWKGYGVQPMATGDDSLIQQYLFEVVCQSSSALYDNVVCLLAYLVQRPGDPWTVALILAGGQGTGKTTLAMIFKRIYGAHYRTEDTLEDLFVSFNSGLLSKVFIAVEEGASGGRSDVWARFKPFITRQDLTINEKYRPEITVPNTTHVLITTNKPELLKVDHDDRRFWILTVKDTWTQAQFKTLYEQIADGRACGRFLDRLKHHALGDFDPQRDRPLTAALADSKERSFTPEESIVREWLQDGQLGAFGHFGPGGLSISRKASFGAYEGAMQRAYKGQKPLGRNTWYERFREMLAGAISEPTKQPDQERQFHLADLDTARAAFDRYAKQTLQWDDPPAVSPSISQPPLSQEDIFG